MMITSFPCVSSQLRSAANRVLAAGAVRTPALRTAQAVPGRLIDTVRGVA